MPVDRGIAEKDRRAKGKRFFAVLMLAALVAACVPWVAAAGPHPPVPAASSRQAVRPFAEETAKAKRLCELARAENRRLRWDVCLSQRAFARARQIVDSGVFAHKDPKTGKNPAWGLVVRCYECRFAGENLSMGLAPAEEIHANFMASRTHRKNILDPHYERMGAGCFNTVCVELFAGF